MDTLKQETIHFKNCLGVFQGGGCKAIAYIGAYRKCVERGVFFSAVAGTSAGSIIASFIAAGATPDKLEHIVSTTKFADLIRPPDRRITGLNPGIVPQVLRLGSKKHRLIAEYLRFLGLKSSEAIEAWIENQLRSLLRINIAGKVRFCDLNLPLSVVATNLETSRPEIWNEKNTPNESVAYAVRCSCNLPIFFQPVDNRFVDGGLLSNLPAFAFQNYQTDDNFSKILCFSFSSNSRESINGEKNAINNLNLSAEDYTIRLISTIIDGASSIQETLQDNLYLLEIDDLVLDTLDFDNVSKETITQMCKAGSNSASKFFDEEIPRLRNIAPKRALLHTEEAALDHLVRQDLFEGDELIISRTNTDYAYKLFPTLLHWVRIGVQITFLTTPICSIQEGKKKHERFKRLVLQFLGITIKESQDIPFEGAIAFKSNIAYAAIVYCDSEMAKETNVFATKYDGLVDQAAIKNLLDKARSCPQQHKSLGLNMFDIAFSEDRWDRMKERLQNVEQYKHEAVSIELEDVCIDNIVFLTRYVKAYKYSQIKRMFKFYEKESIEYFDAMELKSRHDEREILMPVTPPLAEEHGGILYLIEGNSRLMYLLRETDIRNIKMVVVRSVRSALPTTGRFTSNQLLISDQGRMGVNRYENWDYSEYRWIELQVRHPDLYKEFMSE